MLSRTPLWWAPENRNKEVVRILLERNDVNPGTSRRRAWPDTALAAKKGHKWVARTLLERDMMG